MTTANIPAVINQQQDLAHLEGLISEIATLKESYKELTISGLDDKEGYEKVRQAIAVLRTKRTSSEKERKEVGKPYRDTIAFINSKYDVIASMAEEGPGGELELKEKKKAIDDEIAKIEQDKAREAEEKLNNRINELIKNGMVFDGEFYSIKDEALGVQETAIGVVDIRTMSDDLFKNLLQLVVDKNGKIVAEKERLAEQERKDKEEKELRDKKEKEEFEQKKRALDEQEQKLKQQQDKIDNEKREQEQKRISEIIRHRSAILTSMGLEYNQYKETYDYEKTIIITNALVIAEYDDATWLQLIEQVKSTITQKKQEAEDFLQKQKKAEEERIAAQEKERLDGLSDKEKLSEYIQALLAVPVPTEWKTKKWKNIAGAVRDHITDNMPA